jgi:hypothetical protein
MPFGMSSLFHRTKDKQHEKRFQPAHRQILGRIGGAAASMTASGLLSITLRANHLLTLDQIRHELRTYFSDYFGKRTLNHVPSDAMRRTLLVDRLVHRVDEIRTGKPLTRIWN